MLEQDGTLTCCVRCAGAGAADQIARRRQFRSAVFPPPQTPAGTLHPALVAGRTQVGAGPAGRLPGVVTGTALDVSPHVLVVAAAEGERRVSPPTDPGPRRAGRGGGHAGRQPGPATHAGRDRRLGD